LHLVGILFPHINDDARSKSHQNYYSLFAEITNMVTLQDFEVVSDKIKPCIKVLHKIKQNNEYQICWTWNICNIKVGCITSDHNSVWHVYSWNNDTDNPMSSRME